MALLDPRTGSAPADVAVFRALQAGDMLCAVPALRALRAALPAARITLIGLPWAADYARRFPTYVDDFMAFPGYPGLPEQPENAEGFESFAREVRERRFELVLQMHGNGRLTNPLAAGLGARRLAGFRRPEDRRWAGADFMVYPDTGPEIRRLTALVRFLGAPDAGEHLEFPIFPEDEAELAPYPRLSALAPQGYVCVHAGARAADRRWPPQSFARVADAIHADTGLPIVLTGSPPERPLTAALAAAMRSPSIDAALPISLGGLGALIRDARLVVTNDTGASHVAAALQVPSVVLFRCSDLVRWAPLNARLHPAVRDPDGTKESEVLAHARRLLRSAAERAA